MRETDRGHRRGRRRRPCRRRRRGRRDPRRRLLGAAAARASRCARSRWPTGSRSASRGERYAVDPREPSSASTRPPPQRRCARARSRLVPHPRARARRSVAARPARRPGARRRGLDRLRSSPGSSESCPTRSPRVVSMDGSRCRPARRDRIDPARLPRALRSAVLTRRALAERADPPRRAGADDGRRRGGARRRAGARGRADRALLQGRGRRLARAAAPGEARPLPPGRRPLPRHLRAGPDREGRRAVPRGLAPASGQRALRRRREAASGSARRARASRPTAAGSPTRSPAAATSSIRRASLRLKQTRADLTTREAEALGIREQISTFTTEMGPSSSNRIHNVQLMAEYIDGTIIEPGDEFSFNDRVGPRTVERGFREGQMIIGSLLVPAIGGGVCQTATTLFNNAFDLGLPILDRQQPQLLHLALSDGPRRDRLLGRPRLRLPERPEDGDPDQDPLHGRHADVHASTAPIPAAASSRPRARA